VGMLWKPEVNASGFLLQEERKAEK
jgi:hypothetical protein